VSVFRIGASPPPSFDDPIGMLEACHRRMERQLETLVRASAALADDTAGALAALADVVGYFDQAGTRHKEDEEFSVFPRVMGDDTAALLARLEDEHRTHDAIYLAVKAVASRVRAEPALAAELRGDLEAHAAAMVAAYRDHMALEEAELFPLGRALDPRELRAIGIEMRLRRG
jgi:iron-sulfur cluster repair protein YtfE (RIC family)